MKRLFASTRNCTLLLAVGMACSMAAATTLDVHVSSPAGAALQDVAVVLDSPAARTQHTQKTASIAQKDREFMPYMTVVQTGTWVDFPNRDPLKHHVYSFSPAKPFEIKLYAGKPQKPIQFDKPGEVALGCNIHDWMEAYLLVVDTPYFAKTGSDGHARISNVPPGRYTLRLWHPRSTHAPESREVEVRGNALALHAVAVIAPAVIKPRPALESGSY
jgi:plastocyanin